MVRDIWYESGQPTGYVRLSGRGTFTLQGARVALPPLQTPPAADLTNFHGQASFLSTFFGNRIAVSAGAKVLALGLETGEQVSEYVVNTGTPPGQTIQLNARKAVPRGSSVRTADRGAPDPQFLRQMLAQTREEQPQPIGELPAGVSDVRFYRVSVNNTNIGIHLRP